MANLELYKVFYTVAKCGSLTKAGEELYISQPAVSQAVKQLETQLGVPLFNRTHKGMELSEQGGKPIFAKIEKALKLFDEAELLVRQMNASAIGTLRIGLLSGAFERELAEKMTAFCEKFPSVKVEMFVHNRAELLEALRSGKCEAVLLDDNLEMDGLIASACVCTVTHVCVGAEKYAGLTAVPLVQLQKYPIVCTKATTAFLQANGVKVKPTIETIGEEGTCQFAVDGTGIGVLPKPYAEQSLRDKTLFLLPTETELPTRKARLYFKKADAYSALTEAFMQILEPKKGE